MRFLLERNRFYRNLDDSNKSNRSIEILSNDMVSNRYYPYNQNHFNLQTVDRWNVSIVCPLATILEAI